MRISVRNRSLLGTLAIVSMAGYFGLYAYYRFLSPESVLEYVGAYHHEENHFTFSGHARSLGGTSIGESFCGESFVTRLSEWSGRDISEPVNRIFAPAARLDRLLTGRFIRFPGSPAQPVFPIQRTPCPPAEIDFEGFVHRP